VVRLKLVQDLTQELASDLERASSWLQVNTLSVRDFVSGNWTERRTKLTNFRISEIQIFLWQERADISRGNALQEDVREKGLTR
jgi:hypothetical protein